MIINLPKPASASNDGLMTTSDQEFSGNKTFQGDLSSLGTISLFHDFEVLPASPTKKEIITLEQGCFYLISVARYSGSSASPYMGFISIRTDAALIYPILDSSVIGVDEAVSGSGRIRVFSKTAASPNCHINIIKLGNRP